MIEICGRKVKIQTGTKSQTVNICTTANIHGQYNYIVRLSPPFISIATLLSQSFGSIQDLVQDLERHHHGTVERVPAIEPLVQSQFPSRALVHVQSSQRMSPSAAFAD